MKTTLLLSVAALSAAALSAEADGFFENAGCAAKWGGHELTVGNAAFSRTWRATPAGWRTVSWRHGGVEWVAPTGRVVRAGGQPVVSAEKARWSCVGEEGLRVTASLAGRTNVWYVLPSMPGVISERPSAYPDDSPGPAVVPGERAGSTRNRLGSYYRRSADEIAIAPLHVEVTQFDLEDRTDYTNELLRRRKWLLMMRELPHLLGCNVLSVEDAFTGDGLAFVRIAPLPPIRPRQMPDFVLDGGQNNRIGNATLTAVENGWPLAELSYSGGERGRIEALVRFQRALRTYRPGRDGVFLSNTWGGGNGDSRICEEFLMKEVEAGAELGVDVVQIDDGWQKGGSMNSHDAKRRRRDAWGNFLSLDPTFWEPCPNRLPHGLGPVVAAAREKGMRFGLWYGPDSSDEASNWRRDADLLLSLYRKLGVQYFKIDSLKTMTPRAYGNQRRLFDAMLAESGGEMTFDLDVTCGERPGYFGLPHIGPIFVENRYTKHAGYWPHQTLRSVWSLSHVIDPVRMRIELLDPLKHREVYRQDDPLRPELYRADTLFAIAMCASPLGWMELSNLERVSVEQMKPLVARWKTERERIHGGVTYPVGAQPDGRSWTGFATVAPDGGGYLLLFRELSKQATWSFDAREIFPGASRLEVIGGRGAAELRADGFADVTVPEPLDFVWAKVDIPARSGK